MKIRNVAIVVFVDKTFDVLVQERGSHSKVGEKYGFWGGQIEEGETPKQAIERELLEELGFVPKKLDYVGNFSYTVQEEGKYKGWLVSFHVFLSLLTPKLERVVVAEGAGVVKIGLDEVIEGRGFPLGSTKFLEKIESRLREFV